MVEQQAPTIANFDNIEIEVDGLTQNEDFKKNVAIPYFKNIYKDLL